MLQNYKLWLSLCVFMILFCTAQTWQYNELIATQSQQIRLLTQQGTQPQLPKGVQELDRMAAQFLDDFDKLVQCQIGKQGSCASGASLSTKNNNPLNIKDIGKAGPWEGQVGTDKFGHAIFSDPVYGVRAAALTLRSYAQRHNVDTLEGVIKRFARGNQDKYLSYLEQKLGISRTAKLDIVAMLPELLQHMARFESGVDLPDHLVRPYDVVVKAIEGRV